MEKVKFVNQYQKVKFKKRELENKESLTIPGQALSVKEIIERLNRGQDVPRNPGLYDFDKGIVPRVTIRNLNDLQKAREVFKEVKENIEVMKKEALKNARSKPKEEVKGREGKETDKADQEAA